MCKTIDSNSRFYKNVEQGLTTFLSKRTKHIYIKFLPNNQNNKDTISNNTSEIYLINI